MIELVSAAEINTTLPLPGYKKLEYLKNNPGKLSLEDLEWLEELANKEDSFKEDSAFLFKLGQCFENRQESNKAAKCYTKAAELGNQNAQYILGNCYNQGLLGVEEDHKKAVDLFLKSAEKGNSHAMRQIGVCYEQGLGCEQDYTQALQWFKKAAEQGDDKAAYYVGCYYYSGVGIEKDYKTAVHWIAKAAEHGFANAQTELGSAYKLGRGVPQDFAKAVEWYRKAAEQGFASAQTELGLCYVHGQGTNKNPEIAAQWLMKAANQGFAKAQMNLGSLYMHGIGVRKDFVKAVEWYKKAVEQGLASAQTELGICYWNGNGVAKNQKQGVDLLFKAAKQGNARGFQMLAKAAETGFVIEALTYLGECYQNGYAVEVDYNKAIDCYQKAAKQGSHSAEKHLGECYFYGLGVRKDISSAKKWFVKADALSEFERLIEEEAKRQEASTKKNLPIVEQNDRGNNSQQSAANPSFEMYCKEFIENRAECKTFAIFGKGKRFEIITTPLTFNIYNTFKSRTLCTQDDGEKFLDQYKNKNEINDLIELLGSIYRDKSATFKLPSIKEFAAAQSAKVIDKKGVYLVVQFPDFED